MTIEKIIHLIWIGDESKMPKDCIYSWIIKNPEFKVKLWGNEDLEKRNWFFKEQIQCWITKEINGAADIMRWEILYKYGGIALDADSFCLNPLEDWLLQTDLFSVWENELERPGLIATGAIGAIKKHWFINEIIKDIVEDKNLLGDLAWKKVGPLRLTTTYKKAGKNCMTIYPSHFFYPNHFTGNRYSGSGISFANQAWGSTRNSYGKLSF